MMSQERSGLLREVCLAISANDAESMPWANQIIQLLLPLSKEENEMLQKARIEQRGYNLGDLSSL